MKNMKLLGIFIAFLAVIGLAKAVPAHATNVGLSTDVNLGVKAGHDDEDNSGKDDGEDDKDGRRGFFGGSSKGEDRDWNDDGDKDDDRRSDDHNKFWSGIVGKVTAVNSNTITVSVMTPWNKDSKTTVYTVNAANAEIEKDGVDNETISDIKVGDMVVVEGTVTGTTVAATEIHIGWFKSKMEGIKDSFDVSGDPVVGGTVTAVSGTTITIKNKADMSYTIEAKDAKIVRKGSETSVLSDIKVGDNILVQGTINNSSVTAKLIMDTAFKVDGNGNMSGDNGEHRGFWGRIGIFFKGWFQR